MTNKRKKSKSNAKPADPKKDSQQQEQEKPGLEEVTDLEKSPEPAETAEEHAQLAKESQPDYSEKSPAQEETPETSQEEASPEIAAPPAEIEKTLDEKESDAQKVGASISYQKETYGGETDEELQTTSASKASEAIKDDIEPVGTEEEKPLEQKKSAFRFVGLILFLLLAGTAVAIFNLTQQEKQPSSRPTTATTPSKIPTPPAAPVEIAEAPEPPPAEDAKTPEKDISEPASEPAEGEAPEENHVSGATDDTEEEAPANHVSGTGEPKEEETTGEHISGAGAETEMAAEVDDSKIAQAPAKEAEADHEEEAAQEEHVEPPVEEETAHEKEAAEDEPAETHAEETPEAEVAHAPAEEPEDVHEEEPVHEAPAEPAEEEMTEEAPVEVAEVVEPAQEEHKAPKAKRSEAVQKYLNFIETSAETIWEFIKSAVRKSGDTLKDVLG